MSSPTSTLCSIHCPVVAGLFSAETLVTKYRVFTIQISKCRMVAELVAHCLSAVAQLFAGAVEEVVGVEYLGYGGDGAQLILIRSESSDGQDVDTGQTRPDRFLRRKSLKNSRNFTILSGKDFFHISRKPRCSLPAASEGLREVIFSVFYVCSLLGVLVLPLTTPSKEGSGQE